MGDRLTARVGCEWLWWSNPFLLFVIYSIWRRACVNLFILLPLNIVSCCGDALLKMCVCHFYPSQPLVFWLLLRKIIRGTFLFIRLRGFFSSHRSFLRTPQRISFMTFVKCVLIRKLSYPGIFDTFCDVSNFLLHTSVLLLHQVICLYEKTFPHLAFQSVFSLSGEVGYGWTVCRVDSIWDRM